MAARQLAVTLGVATAALAAMVVGPLPAAYAAAPDKLSEASTAEQEKVFYTRGDHVHISSTAPRAASGHGWWLRGTSDATKADVTVQLQIEKGGRWRDVGEPGSERVKPGGGSANRANARAVCANSTVHRWRSVIDTDLVGYADSPDKLITPARSLACGV